MGKLTNNELLEIGIAVVGGVLLGWLLKKLIIPMLIRFAKKTKWKSDDLIIESIAKWIVFWFFLLACLYILPIFSNAYGYINKYDLAIRNTIGALFIFSFTWALARILAGMLQIRSQVEDKEFASSSIMGNIVKAIVYCIGLILVLQTFGVAIAPLLTALGVGGIAVALALQPTLSNLFSGLQLIASGKINIGDFVQLEGGQKGFIKDITWRNTTIETAQNNVIVVPNSKMADSILENFFLTDKQITFNVMVGVSYDSNLEHVEKVSIEVAKKVLSHFEGGVKEFEPLVRFYNFGDSSIDLKIFLRVHEYADQFLITSEFIKALHKRYNEESINIPFPIRTILMQGNK